MRDRDLADSPLASIYPDISGEVDTLRDRVLQRVADCFRSDHAARHAAQLAINAAFDESSGSALDQATTQLDVIVPILRLLSADLSERKLAMRAAALLRLLGQDPRSFQEMADDYGVRSRACPHAVYRSMQKRLGLRGRGDKSESARENCRARLLGKKREPRPGMWVGLLIYEKRNHAA